ncbi:MAG: hypothetical protein WCJ35_07335 [Planctomycetota bacterium]
MKQFYYTSCRTGKSVSGASGFQVRAVSPSLTSDQARMALRYASYALPAGTVPSEATQTMAPVRLSLLRTADLGLILCHAVCAGKDPMTGRYGNFFAHLLVDVPMDMGVGRAIGSWGSPFWRRVDDDRGVELPEISQIGEGTLLNNSKLAAFASEKGNRDLLTFVLTAILATKPDQRIVVAATPEDVAICVYAATRALPHGLLDALTFSTYENEPLSCSARLIGTCWADLQKGDLPSSCYSGTCVGYNPGSGKKTDLPKQFRCVDWFVRALASEDNQRKVDGFCDTCNQLDIESPELVELLFRFKTKDGLADLSQDDSLRVLRDGNMSAHVLKASGNRVEFLEKVVGWAQADVNYFQTVYPLVTQILSPSSDMLDPITGLTEPTRESLKGWLFLADFLSSPQLDTDCVDRLRQVLLELPGDALPQVFQMLVPKISQQLSLQQQYPDAQDRLRHMLTTLGPWYPGQKFALFHAILGQYSPTTSLYWKNSPLMCAVVGVACADLPWNAARRDVSAIIKRIQDHDAQNILNRIGREADKWSSSAADNWRDVAPRSLWDRLVVPSIFVFVILLLLLFVALLHWRGYFKVPGLDRWIPQRVNNRAAYYERKPSRASDKAPMIAKEESHEQDRPD